MTMTQTLPAALAGAESAENEPRARVQQLDVDLGAALAREDYAAAQQLSSQLHEAREQLAVAEATTAALRQRAQVVSAQRAAVDQQLADARSRDQARRQLDAARADDEQGMAAINAALDQMRDHLTAASRCLRSAIARERQVEAARQAVIDARQALGEFGAGFGPRAARPNQASALAERDPLIHRLAAWSPS
jgi:chromosome segregation ATPase